ncbi:MAG: hypothetical protein ACLP4V_19650 [Methylocella sp.]|jgi:hypothetical protein
MIEVSSRRASDAEGHFGAGGLFVRLFSDRRIRMAAAISLLAGGFNITGRAYAQDAASCVEKCKADEKQCLHNGSSEELCDYDSKACQKACNASK